MKPGLRLEVVPYDLRFRNPLITGSGTFTERRGYWVRLHDGEGRTGIGEIAPLPGFSEETLDDVARSLRRLVENQTILRDLPATAPSIHAGIELALLDLQGKSEGKRIADLLSDRPRARVRLNALLVQPDPKALALEAREAVAAGFGTLKIKVGIASPEEDAARVGAVREAVGTGIPLRADANGAWDVVQAIHVLRLLEPFGLEYVEQPVARDLGPVHRYSPIPIAADESAATPSMARLLIQERAVDVLILKPMILGGPLVAARIVQEAQAGGIAVVITSSLETPVGLAGSLHLAAALPGPERACGLATAGFLEAPPLEGLPDIDAGWLPLPADPGLGIRFADAAS